MAYPIQKKYTLDEVVRYIALETGVPHTKDTLLQQAKNGRIGICFYVKDTNLRFIRLDEPNNNWESVSCPPLFGKDSLKRIVIPIGNPNQKSHFAGHTQDPRDEKILPVLEYYRGLTKTAIREFADNPDKKTTSITPWRISAGDSDTNTIIKIAIIKCRHIGSSDSIQADEYIEWQKEHGLQEYIPDNKAESNGNFKYFETQTTMEISRDDLCITYKALQYYIQNIRLDQIHLDEPYYSLKDAKYKIKEIAKKKVQPHNLIKKAINGKIKLSFHKPEWKYVRIDKPEHEMEIMPCKILDNDTIYLIVPKKGLFKDTKRFNKKGLNTGTGVDDHDLCLGNHVWSEPETQSRQVYPYVTPTQLKSIKTPNQYANPTMRWHMQQADKFYEIPVSTHGMDAIFEGNHIKVSKVNNYYFPEKGDSNYLEFIKWLESNITWKSTNTDKDGLFDPRMHFNAKYFYKLVGFKGRGVEITVKDLVITREELGEYILSIMDAPSPSLPLQETAIYQSPVSDSTTLTNKNETFSKFFNTTGLTNGRFFYESSLTNGWQGLDDNELNKLSANEYLKELSLFCESNEFSFEHGLVKLRDQISGDLTNKSFETLYETAISRLNSYAQHPTTPKESVQAPEPVAQTKLNNKEKPKARDVIEGLKTISETQPKIDDTKLIEGMKDLILFIYGEEPEQKQIVND